jgi:membrane protein DedA with SNARE-associated domain
MVQQLLGHFTYLAIFGLLIAGGVGVPVPEELVQLTAGYLAHRGVLWLPGAMATVWVALVIGDFILFQLGRRHGPRILESARMSRLLTPRRRAFIERHFARHAVLTIAVARHASGLRVPVFALAGASKVPAWEFVAADGLSALVSVPIVVWCGWYFSTRLEEVRRDLHEIELVVGLLALTFLVGWYLWARRRPRA